MDRFVYKISMTYENGNALEPIECMPIVGRYYLDEEAAGNRFLDAFPEAVRGTSGICLDIREDVAREILALLCKGPGEYGYSGVTAEYEAYGEYPRVLKVTDAQGASNTLVLERFTVEK